jgi:hypothetical protein
MRVVVSLTTIPTREKSVIQTIHSLQTGTFKPDAIYVNLPEWYPRFKRTPDLNLEAELKTLGVIANKCKDYGVLTKLIPTLELETDPETLIVIVDDDANYQPRFLEGLVKGHIEFKCPVGYSGIAYPESVLRVYGTLRYHVFFGHGTPTEMLECSFGFAIPRGVMEGFPKLEPMSEDSDKCVYLSDDYLYSRFIDFKRTPKKVICYPWAGRVGDDWSTIWIQNSDSQAHSLSRDENNLHNFMMAGLKINFV